MFKRRAGLALMAVPAVARAQGFPTRPIRLVIPFTAGGSNDIVGRILAEAMSARLGQPIVIENRGGAGGLLGNDLVAKAPADGYTILLAGSGSFVISSLTVPRVPYDVVNGFAPIGGLGAAPNVIAVNPSLPVTSLAELRDYARANGPITFGTPGAGTTAHALGAMIALTLGFEIDFIHYRGTAPALTDVVAGRVQMITNAAAPFLPFLASGRLRALAIAGRQRASVLPELSTSLEQGFPEIDSATWYGLLAPAGTPPEPIARLHAAMNAALADPAIRARMVENGVEIETSPTPEDFGRFLVAERERWGVVVRRASLRAE
ncbi:tripartite tricarboxylate transporter substrate binding protein [Roseococcus sp. SYP-B2431]|uniref:Bug family tripartite tricarboxylate transporter substrate binding protein n=1 Tax=Roseococcus sp. SYP-B2431 TaxID=2496640 RepID=UPI00103F1F0B|nr:tripartite tricarboxylate transporter substrate binding protein [Roseococcus sp. SYP-B2431]TCH96362.1 tripartite tricarboxylate transporter substrate binding protein [Roseococcus sp. SYP-B2431]